MLFVIFFPFYEFLISFAISFLNHGVFRNVLFHFQGFVDGPIVFLLFISNMIPVWFMYDFSSFISEVCFMV